MKVYQSSSFAKKVKKFKKKEKEVLDNEIRNIIQIVLVLVDVKLT